MLRVCAGVFVVVLLASSTAAFASDFRWRSQETCGEERQTYNRLSDLCSRNPGAWVEQRALYRPEPDSARAQMTDSSNGSTWSMRMRCQDRAEWARMCRY